MHFSARASDDSVLPPRLANLLKRDKNFGPNCYNVPLYLHNPHMEIRYVGWDEFQYHLNRDFQKIAEIPYSDISKHLLTLQPGDLIFFDRGAHVAVYVGNARVFDTALLRHDSYRVIPINEAHIDIDTIAPGTEIGLRMTHLAMGNTRFSSVSVYRFSRNENPLPQPDDVSTDHPLTPLLTFGVNTLLPPLMRNFDRALPRIFLDTTRSLMQTVKLQFSSSAPFSSLSELTLELESLLEWYGGYINHFYMSSPYASYHKIAATLEPDIRPNLDDAITRTLIRMLLVTISKAEARDISPTELEYTIDLVIAQMIKKWESTSIDYHIPHVFTGDFDVLRLFPAFAACAKK